jgi:hypothetical protein
LNLTILRNNYIPHNACATNYEIFSDWSSIYSALLERNPESATDLYYFWPIESMILIINQLSPVQISSNSFKDNAGGRGIIYLTLKQPLTLPRSIYFKL